MARTNLPVTHSPVVTHEGAPAYRLTAEKELRRTVMACLLWEDTFYEDGQSVAHRIATLVPQIQPEKVAAMAVEARTRMKLRHVPLWLARHLAKTVEGRKQLGTLLPAIIQRPDELTEFLSLYWKNGKEPLAAQVKRGLAAAFGKFNSYSLAKYNQEGAVKLRDVLFMVHAKPRDAEQAVIWKQLVEGTLPAPDTWEVALSAGQDKQATWVRLMAEGQLGALALLRNLRNMQEVEVPMEAIRAALNAMSVERVLPFRFVAAARYAPLLEPELEQAMFKAVADTPKLSGRTMLLVDGSGSMFGTKISVKSDLERFDAAAALAILVRESCEQVGIMVFSDNGVIVPARRGFALRDALRQAASQRGTYTEQAKQAADKLGYDRLIIVTDEQSHEKLSDPKGKGYVINVAPYQTGIGYGPWTHVDGWSESVLDYIREAETVADGTPDA